MRAASWLVVVASPLGLGAPLAAQSLPDIGRAVTEGSQIEDAIARSTQRREGARDDEEAIDGEAGIYVLKKEDIFFVAANAGLAYSDNPLRTVDNVGGSGSNEAGLTVGMQTIVAGDIDLGASVNFETTRYFEDFAPSNNVASGALSAGTALGKTQLYLGLAAFGGWNLDSELKRPSSFHGASVQLSAPVPVSANLLLQPLLVASRVLSETQENDLYSVGGRLTATTRVGIAVVSASVSATRFWYDNFYEDVTFVARRDWQYEAGLLAAVPVGRNVRLAASARFTRRDSSFFLSNYDSLDGGVAFSARWQF